MRVLVIGPGFDLRASIKTAMDFGGLLVLDESFYGYGIEYRPGKDLQSNVKNVIDHLPMDSEPLRLKPYHEMKEKNRSQDNKFRAKHHSRKI